MHESKTNAPTRGNSSASSNFKVNNNNLPNNRVTSSANNDNNNNNNFNNFDHSKKGKKKLNRDKQLTSNDDAKPASAMSNLSSYSLIDDDHIDDQETINVGNLIIDLESDLEKEKIENEQANTGGTENISAKSSQNLSTINAPSSTSTSGPTKLNLANKCNLANSDSDSRSGVTKSGQRSNLKHLNVTTGSSGTSNSNNNVNIANNGHTIARTIFKSSADERGELKMKITRETKPGKGEHKLTANQKSPTSSGAIGGILGKSNINFENDCKNYLDPAQSSSISSTKECGTSTSVGTITEPDCLGPCEPGTSVTLEGIVWQETDGGILVVNVTWRGKTYVGALLDCTRHDWAPPRLCDSPASDIDLKTSKGVRAKRIVTRSNGNNTIDEKNLLQTTGKLRNGKGRRIPAANEPTPSCSKKQRDSLSIEAAQVESNTPHDNTSSINNSENLDAHVSADNINGQQDSISTSNILMDKAGPHSPMLIGCDEPNCSKRYRNMNGLLYHQAHAHGTDNDTSSHQDEGCSSSTKDKSDKASRTEPAPENQVMNTESTERTNQNAAPPDVPQQSRDEQQQGLKRHRTPSPLIQTKINKLAYPSAQTGVDSPPTQPSDSPNSPFTKRLETERRHSNSSNNGHSSIRLGEPGRRSPGAPTQGRSSDNQQHGSSNSGHHLATKSSHGIPKQNNPIAPLPAPAEEGMKPSVTSTGPPPSPHQGNCYFSPAFLANAFNPYPLPPYFNRNIYDPMAPPTSNAAFLTRFMSNMRVPPPPSESPSRLLSPSMAKNIPFSPFKVDPSIPPPPPPPIPATSLGGHPLPNISPHLPNPQHAPPPPPPPTQVPPIPQVLPGPPPPPPLGGGSPSLRMPSQGDPLLPPTSQPPFLPPTSLSSFLGMHGMPNPLGPMGGPQMPNLVDDTLAKQFPRRFH